MPYDHRDPAIDVDPITDPLESLHRRGFGRFDVFRDWVSLMLAGLTRDDETYLSILERYDRGKDHDHGDRPADLFSAAFGELLAETARTNRDVLGVTYEAFGMQNKAFGQHFTPWSVSKLLVALQGPGQETATDPPVTVADPACGSGRLLVLAARQADAPTVCFGQDKDRVCCQMAALNLCFFNVDGYVVYGDSLTMEKRRAWRTHRTASGGEVESVDPHDLPWPESAVDQRQTGDDQAQAAGKTVEGP